MPHHSLWRRFRWRYRQSFLMQIVGRALGAPQAVCLILWLIPHGRDLAAFQVCRWLWFAFCIVAFCLLGVAVLFSKIAAFVHMSAYQWPRSKALVGFAIYFALASLPVASVALAVGRIDWAGGLLYCGGAFNHLSYSWKRKTWTSLPSAVADLIVLASLPIHSAKLALCGIAASLFTRNLRRLDWEGIVRQKPTKSAYIQDMQAAYASPQNQSSNLLKNLCELEMWEEAAQEFQRLRAGTALDAKGKIFWKIRLAAGTGQNQDALLRIAEQSASETSDDILLLTAQIYAQEGKREAALAAIAKIRFRWPDYSRVGEVYAAMDDTENALRYYERASRFNNKYQLLWSMASTLMALKQYKDAAFVYRDAVAAAPYLATYELKNLAFCYRQSGKERAALQAEALAAQGE